MNPWSPVAAADPWAYLWSLGYRRLIPIKIRDKRPAIEGWTTHIATKADIAAWSAAGYGIGIVGAGDVRGADADCFSEADATIAAPILDKWLPNAPIRVGRAPKTLRVFRAIGDIPYQRFEFGSLFMNGGDGPRRPRIEIIGAGKQFVAHGIHPETGEPYRWTRRLVPVGDLPALDAAAVDAMMAELAAALPDAGPIARSGELSLAPDQESLRAESMETLGAAVRAIPNTDNRFPSREAYLEMGYAIKAAAGEVPGLELFQDWCARWDGGVNDPETVAADWGRMKPPFRVGASWLYGRAEEIGGVSAATFWADALPPPPPEPRKPGPTPYAFPLASAIPPRQALYAGHYIRRWISSTIAPSKVGKSSLALAEALAMASGKPLLGINPTGCYRVWWWNGEDPQDELYRRVAAAMQHFGLTREDIGDRLLIDSGRDMEILLARQGKTGAVLNDEALKRLVSGILENRIDASIFDPLISLHRVSENDNNGIDMMTKALNRVADETNSAIELPHHTRKLYGGGATVEDGRGASALLATTRSTRALAKMTKEEASRLGVPASVRARLLRFTDAGNNVFLPDAALEDKWMELKSVNLGNGAGEGMDKIIKGDSVGVMTVCDLAAARATAASFEDNTAEADALAAIRKHEYRRDARSDAWVGVPIAIACKLNLDAAEDLSQVKNIIKTWLKEGKLVEESRLNNFRQVKTFVTAPLKDNLSWLE